MIKEKDINIFIEGRKNVFQDGKIKIPEVLEELIVGEIQKQMRASDFIPTYTSLLNLINESLDGQYAVNENHYKLYMWKPISNKEGGRPSAERTKRWAASREKLKEALRKTIFEWNKSGSKTPQKTGD